MMRFLASVLAIGALALSACSSNCCPKNECGRVWVPPRTVMKVCYETVPADTREVCVEETGICRRPIMGPANTPIVERRVVVDRCATKAPTYDWVCTPKMGYREVEDRVDRFCPTYGMECRQVTEPVHVLRVGVGWDRCCGPKAFASLTKECRTTTKPMCVKTGETLVSLRAGSHMQQVEVGDDLVRIPVGERDVSAVTGTHIENVQTGIDKTPVVYGYENETIVKGQHPATRQVRPWRYRGVERPVQLPGFWARICDDPRESNGADVLTRAEYEEYLADAKR